MARNEKWLMFKNYMHNELGITKDDVEVWTRDAIKEVAEKYVKYHFTEDAVKKVVQDEIHGTRNPWRNSSVKDVVIKELIRSLDVEIKIKDK